MVSFCGPEWRGDWIHRGDLQPCAQAVIINIPPTVIMIAIGMIHIARLWNRQVQLQFVEIQPRLPIAIGVILTTIGLIALVEYFIQTPREPYQLVQAGLSFLAWLINVTILCMERRRIFYLHIGIRLFWFIDCLTLIKSVQSATLQLARGEQMDDTMLLYFLRLPFQVSMLVYALIWRRRGYDEEAEMKWVRENGIDGIRGGSLHLNSPSNYAPVERYENTTAVNINDDSINALPAIDDDGIWSRFLKFAGQRNDAKYHDLSLNGVHHIDTGSFVRESHPLPRSPMTPMSAVRADPQAHPLFESELSVACADEHTVAGRTVVQYCLKVRIRSKKFASGDDAIDTLTVWKKYGEFVGLHSILQQTCDKYNLPHLPYIPPPTRQHANLEHARLALELYLQEIMLDPSYFPDIGAFIRLGDKVDQMRHHKVAQLRQQPRRASDATIAPTLVKPIPVSGKPADTSLSSSLPASAFIPSATSMPTTARDRSSTRLNNWTIIGVSITAWMKWCVETGTPTNKEDAGSTYVVRTRELA